MAETILKHGGINVDKPLLDADGSVIPLFIARYQGHTAVVRLLLADSRSGIQVARMHKGWSALHAAVLAGSLRTVQVLVVRGVSVAAVDSNGFTPVD